MAKVVAAILGLVVALSIIATPIAATPDEVKWVRVTIPGEGKAGSWALAPGSDIQHLTVATDGTLYAYGKGLSYTLYQSTDGYHWSYTGKVSDAIVDIATNADAVYYATASAVYRSTDGGNRFTRLGGNPGGAGSNNIEITAIDVTTEGSSNLIAVATRDKDGSQFGGVYLLNESKPVSEWVDTSIGSYDVYAIAFSPNFATDRQLVAVVTDEADTFVTTKIGTDAWGQTVGNARIGASVVVDTSAAIVFPNDYDINDSYVQFVAIDAGDENGDVYLVDGVEAPNASVATDLGIGSGYGLSNVDVTGLAISGEAATATLLAGAAGSAEVYFSTDGGNNWTKSTKPPTGQTTTYVVMAPDFAGTGQAYAATSGSGSAVSFTRDGGTTWNQIGLIDSDMSDIIDLAPSPDYSRDDTLFMVTWGGKHSLWRSLSSGNSWERVYASTLADVDQIDRVELPPDYGNGSQVVFIVGSSNGSPAIWKSTDNGQEFTDRSVPFPIDTWAVADDKTLFLGSYDGTDGLVYRTTNSGLSYATGAVAGSQPINSIVLSPEYDNDETILVGNTDGWVYWSNDNGTSFEPVPADATSPPITGVVTVAFDPEFSQNNTIYAASNTPDEGIYRFITDKSTSWEKIDSTLPDGGMVSQLKVAADGTLYATNSQQVDTEKKAGGTERCLNPKYALGPTFETVTRGLDDGATLTGLWLHGNRLWSVDTTNTRLLSYIDSLTVPVSLTSPGNKAPGIGTIASDVASNVRLDWEGLSGAIRYLWQLNYDADFSTIPDGFEDETEATSARLPPLDTATRYYWRVRATEPVLSPWSAKWSFTTSLGTETVAPELYAPEASASNVPTRPVLQWSAVAGAERYELLVATDISFTSPIITRVDDYALPSTAWECDIELSHGTTYYWKVRAISSESSSAWSATGAFTTELPPTEALPAPAPAPAPPPAPPPPPSATTDWTKWLVFLGGALFITMVAILVTMILLIVRVRRP
jgi:hypothetical protein